VAALEGVTERQSGLASGLLNTSTQFGAAIGTAIASSVLASGTNALLRAGDAAPTALTGGFHRTFWVLAAIALAAPPATFAVRRAGRREASRRAVRRGALSRRRTDRFTTDQVRSEHDQ
jgi:hypothetical protein